MLRHTGWRSLTNPGSIAPIVLLAVAVVGGPELVRFLAVGAGPSWLFGSRLRGEPPG